MEHLALQNSLDVNTHIVFVPKCDSKLLTEKKKEKKQ